MRTPNRKRARRRAHPADIAAPHVGRLVCAVAVAIGLVVFASSPLEADRVELETGEVFFGDILRANEHEVSIRLRGGGLLSFRMTFVRHYRRDTVVHDDWQSGLFLDTPDWGSSARTGPTRPVSRQPDPRGPATGGSGARTGVVTRPKPDPNPPPESLDLARPHPAPRAHTPTPRRSLDPRLVDPLVTYPKAGYSLAPPKGFLRWDDEKNRAIAGYFQDPVTQANLTVLAYPSEEPIETIKKKAARSYVDQVRNFRVVRDERLKGVAFEGWLFEVKSELAGSVIHQVQVFASRENRVYVLTFSTPEKHFARYRKSFDESVRSLRLLAPEQVEPDGDEDLTGGSGPAGGEAGDPGDPGTDKPPPRSLESLLEATTGRRS